MTATLYQLPSSERQSDSPILVPDGEYTVIYLNHQTGLFMGKHPKLTVRFSIQDFGEHYLSVICAYYNIHRIISKPKKNGRFVPGKRSDFVLDYSDVFGYPGRIDRISMSRFKNTFVKVKTRTVTHNRIQRKYPEGLQYSVVDRMLERIEV